MAEFEPQSTPLMMKWLGSPTEACDTVRSQFGRINDRNLLELRLTWLAGLSA